MSIEFLETVKINKGECYHDPEDNSYCVKGAYLKAKGVDVESIVKKYSYGALAEAIHEHMSVAERDALGAIERGLRCYYKEKNVYSSAALMDSDQAKSKLLEVFEKFNTPVFTKV